MPVCKWMSGSLWRPDGPGGAQLTADWYRADALGRGHALVERRSLVFDVKRDG
jgi:hypothetical protein